LVEHRAPDGAESGSAAADWNLDATSTFASANDQLPAGLGLTSVFLNEAGNSLVRASGTCAAPAVELHNHAAAPADLTDWQLIDTACGVSFFDYLPPGTAT